MNISQMIEGWRGGALARQVHADAAAMDTLLQCALAEFPAAQTCDVDMDAVRAAASLVFEVLFPLLPVLELQNALQDVTDYTEGVACALLYCMRTEYGLPETFAHWDALHHLETPRAELHEMLFLVFAALSGDVARLEARKAQERALQYSFVVLGPGWGSLLSDLTLLSILAERFRRCSFTEGLDRLTQLPPGVNHGVSLRIKAAPFSEELTEDERKVVWAGLWVECSAEFKRIFVGELLGLTC